MPVEAFIDTNIFVIRFRRTARKEQGATRRVRYLVL